MTGTGGIAETMGDLIPHLGQKLTGAVVLYDDDPVAHLVPLQATIWNPAEERVVVGPPNV